MKLFKQIGLVLALMLFLSGLSLYYLYQLKLIPSRIAESDRTMLKTDSMRGTFKVTLMMQRGLQQYQKALRESDEDLVYDAIDYMLASLGFVYSGFIEKQGLIDRVVPLIRQNIQLVETHLLAISQADLKKLHENTKKINWETEQIEKTIWVDFQSDYVNFQRHEYRLKLIYQLATVSSLIFLVLIAFMYYRQRSLNQVYHKTQKALVDSEKQYRQLVETTSVIAWELDISSLRFTYMSPRVEELTGFSQELWEGFNFWVERLHPEDREWASEFCMVETEKGRDHIFEYRMLTRKGEIIWIRDVVTVVMQQGKPVTLRGYFIDNTERKLAELSLKKNERWLAQIMDTLPNGVQECDVDGKITYSNIEHHQILGVANGSLPGHHIWDFVPGDQKKIELRDYLRHLVSVQPEPEIYEVRNVTIDGCLIDVEVVWDYRRNDQGEVTGFISIISDVTERKLIQNELKEKEKSLANAQKIAHVGNWELKLDENKLSWSDEVFRIFEIDPHKFAASYEAFVNAIHPEDRELVNNAYADSVLNEAPYDIEHRLLMPDGRVKYVVERGETIFDKHAKPLCSIGIVMDITERELVRQQFEQSESKFRAITEQATDGITVADPEGRYLFVNKAFCDMIGYSEQELLTMTVFDVKAPEQDKTSFERTKGRDQGLSVQVELQRKDGSIFISEVIGKMIEFDGQTRVLGTVRDISERTLSENALRTSEQRFQDFAETAADLFWEMDKNLRFTYVSGKVNKLMGQNDDAVIGKNRQELYAGQPISETVEFEHHLKLIEAHKPFDNFITSWIEADGEMRFIQVSGKPRFDSEGDFLGYRGVSQDITDSKMAEEKILHQAHFDTLTGLPNRFLSLDRLTQLVYDAERNEDKVAVLFLDLDDFKKVNDTLGHETGDKLLIEASERLKHAVRNRDTVGRLGGDEFIVLLGGVNDASDAIPMTENIINCLRDSFHIEGRELILSGSVGIALYPQDGLTPSDLLRNADSAMYHAKELGRNTYSFFTEAMNQQVSRRLEIEEQIHGALGRKEFSVFYQPKIDVNTSEIIGAEALLRWNNPALGFVSPAEFIPIAEQTGLIVSIGNFVLSEALSKTALWQKTIPDLKMAVNLSPSQFRDPKLVQSVKHSIKQSGVGSEHLELEITEGVLMSGHAYIDAALSGLKDLGVSIAMDDFGTGYSSLGYLRNYPFDVLKIDQTFVRDITVDQADRELINAAVAMAHGLNLLVVAEGVETVEQLDYLKSIGCDCAQGYLFGKPVPADDFTQLL